MDITDQQIARNLAKSIPKEAKDDKFDCSFDDGSHPVKVKRDLLYAKIRTRLSNRRDFYVPSLLSLFS